MIDTVNPQDTKVTLQLSPERAVSLLLGAGGYAAKVKNALQYYPQILRDHPDATVLNLRVPGRITYAPSGGVYGQ